MTTAIAARLRTHHVNLQRYRGILTTDLTPYERSYVERRIEEEEHAVRSLNTSARAGMGSDSAIINVEDVSTGGTIQEKERRAG